MTPTGPDTQPASGSDKSSALAAHDEGAHDMLRHIGEATAAIRRRADLVAAATDEEVASAVSDELFEAANELQDALFDYMERIWSGVDDSDGQFASAARDGDGAVVLDVIGRWRYAITDVDRLNKLAAGLESDCIDLDERRPELSIYALLHDREHPLGGLPGEVLELEESMVDIFDARGVVFDDDDLSEAIHARGEPLFGYSDHGPSYDT